MSDDRVRVILDTNVFVAAYWAGASASARLLDACIDGLVLALYSREVRAEVSNVLRTIRAADDFIARIEPFWERAEMVSGVRVDGTAIRDPSDRKFLEAAAGGQADFLITNDDHLLSVGYIGRTEVITPRTAVRVLGL